MWSPWSAAARPPNIEAFGRSPLSRSCPGVGGNLAAEQVALLVGALGFVLIALRWLTDSDFTKYGLFLGILASAAVAYGALATMREQGIAMPDMDDIKSVADGDDGDDETPTA